MQKINTQDLSKCLILNQLQLPNNTAGKVRVSGKKRIGLCDSAKTIKGHKNDNADAEKAKIKAYLLALVTSYVDSLFSCKMVSLYYATSSSSTISSKTNFR